MTDTTASAILDLDGIEWDGYIYRPAYSSTGRTEIWRAPLALCDRIDPDSPHPAMCCILGTPDPDIWTRVWPD